MVESGRLATTPFADPAETEFAGVWADDELRSRDERQER